MPTRSRRDYHQAVTSPHDAAHIITRHGLPVGLPKPSLTVLALVGDAQHL